MGDPTFSNKRCWVSGAGSGIGAAAARALAADGFETVLSGRRLDALDRTAAQIEQAGGRCVRAGLDVADPEACAEIARRHGPFDVVVASAGTNVRERRLSELSADNWQRVVDTNLGGALNMVRAALPGLRERDGGLVVLVSSWVAWRLEPVAGAAYGASKRALGALAEIINVEEGRHGIRATHFCPAETDTEVLDTRPVPPPREERELMLRADDVGRLIAYLAASPPHVCVNEIVVSPVANRFYRQGGVQ